MKNPTQVKNFGTHLRKIREERGLSQKELGDMANVAKITIQRIENAKYAVTLDVLFSIAIAIEMSVSDLVKI